jgi:hypothetical protein
VIRRRVLTSVHAAVTLGLACALVQQTTRHETAVPRPVVPSPFEAVPSVALTDLVWDDFHGMPLPRASDGPRRRDGDRASGFARTPRGALLAVIHIAVRAAPQWEPAVFEQTIDQQVIGPDQPQLATATGTGHDRLGKRDVRAFATVEGFRWLGYSPDAATLDVLSSGPGDDDLTVRAVTRIEVQWKDADWRAIAPLGGDWANAAVPVGAPDGFTLFPVRG